MWKRSDCGVVERLDAGGGEVLRVDELIAVAAVADDPDFFAVLDELEEDGEQAEAAAVDDGGAADGDDVEVGLVVGLSTCSAASLERP